MVCSRATQEQLPSASLLLGFDALCPLAHPINLIKHDYQPPTLYCSFCALSYYGSSKTQFQNAGIVCLDQGNTNQWYLK